MAHGGLALATSLSALICVVLLYFSLKKKIGTFGEKRVFIVLLKVLLSSIIMGVITKLFYNYLYKLHGSGLLKEILNLGLSVCVGVVIYGVLIYLFKIEEINILTKMIKSKLKNK